MDSPGTEAPSRISPWIVVAVAVLAVAVGYLGRALLERAVPAVPAGQESPERLEFSLTSLDGATVSAGDFEGRVLVVDFWATWCGPCRLQEEILEELLAQYSTQPVSFLGINVSEPEELVQEFATRDPFSYPVLIDPTGSLSARYDIYALPTVMIVAGDQRIAYSHVGVSTREQVARAIDRALADG